MRRRSLAGRESLGAEYDDEESMWEREAGSKKQKDDWYDKGEREHTGEQVTANTGPWGTLTVATHLAGLRYWAALPATVDTVLGGYARVSPSDVRESAVFLESVFPAVTKPGASLTVADCGAGVGRVTEHLLLRYFTAVDLVEPVKSYMLAAEEKLTPLAASAEPPRVLRYVVEPLQEWTPEKGRYDVIWIQWCVGHCTDDDLISLLHRCGAGLKRGGMIVMKENNCAEGFIVDKEDSSLTRSNDYFLALFARATMTVVKVKLQRNFPSELFPVRMYALKPE